MSASVSTHVLDVAAGRPVAGLAVALYRGDALVARGTTDADGRIRSLGEGLDAGEFRLVFDLGSQYGGAGFFRQVSFTLRIGEGHHHVPLLLSPFGAVSYRGS